MELSAEVAAYLEQKIVEAHQNAQRNLDHQQKAFTNTITVLKDQRDAHADTIVQLTVQVMGLTEIKTSLEASLAAMATQLHNRDARFDSLQSRYDIAQEDINMLCKRLEVAKQGSAAAPNGIHPFVGG